MSIDGVIIYLFIYFWVVSFQHFVKNIKNTTNHHHNFLPTMVKGCLRFFHFENCQNFG